MNKIEKLIDELCPNGVEYAPLWELTFWNKKFSGVAKEKQKEILNYKCYETNYLKNFSNENGNIKILTTNISNLWAKEEELVDEIYEDEVVCIPGGGNPVVQYYNGRFISCDNRIGTSADKNILNNKYLYHYLLNNMDKISSFYRGSGIKHPDMTKIIELSIPVPPMSVQSEIVRILDSFTELTSELTSELTKRKMQYEYYSDFLINCNKNSVLLPIEKIGNIKMCKRILKAQTNTSEGVPFYKIGTFGKEPDAYISSELFEEYKNKYSYPKKGDILISCSGTIGKTVIFDDKPAYFQDSNIVWLEHDETIVTNKYLYYCYNQNPWKISNGGTISRLYNSDILKTKIPVPPIDVQNKIVQILDKFDALVSDISQGIPAEIEARKKQYEYYRNKLLTFENSTN